LLKFPKFVEFSQRSRSKKYDLEVSDEDDLSPSELMDKSLDEIHDVLASDILEQLLKEPPQFFEHTVVDLFQTMGYGTGRAIGQSGDNGIDGIIDQDKLGLERVYIQAKRYQQDQKISSSDIRNFAGSLSLHQANKGVFVTTTQFTVSAKETADKLPNRIVLIDGKHLANLMIEHNIGCSTKREYVVKQLDKDYFNE
jgi:restriction system protein